MGESKNNIVSKSDSKLTIHDTEFLLRLFQGAAIKGAEIDQAKLTCDKIRTIHKRFLDVEVGV
tara:strand:- start:7243 stop:7431 length:189 start_codon:yes stop_codon:yes gene_type:complete